MPDDQQTPPHAIAERSEQDADAEHYEPAPVDDIEWSDEPEEMPRRPRRRLLAPIPVALLAVLLLAGGFFAGVQVEKSQSSSSSTGAPSGLPAGLAALQRGSSKAQGNASSAGGSAASGLPSGFPGAAGAGGITTGEVSYVRGNTLYVTNGEGTTVKVHSAAGASVTKTVTTSAHKIHPGETVVVRGTTAKNGAVSASSISVSASSTAGSTSSSSGAPTAGGGASALFGSGG
jgi:hypothetical protein